MLRLMNMLTLESTDSNNMLLIVLSSPHDPIKMEKSVHLQFLERWYMSKQSALNIWKIIEVQIPAMRPYISL